jgi:hypothetical protein
LQAREQSFSSGFIALLREVQFAASSCLDKITDKIGVFRRFAVCSGQEVGLPVIRKNPCGAGSLADVTLHRKLRTDF